MTETITHGKRGIGVTPPLAGPVAPTERACTALRPLGTREVGIESGFWAERRRLNREVTLLAGATQLEETGTLDNLRVAAGRGTGGYRGVGFDDSDVYKWLEAVSWELGREPAEELNRLARDTTDLIAAAQLEDGYLNSYCQIVDPAWRFTDLAMGHELYCAGHLIQAAVAQTRATGDEKLLEVARRFADYIDGVFGEDGRVGVCGHPEIEMALVELYRLTADRRYLDLASIFIERRGHGLLGPGLHGSGYYQDHEPVREARTITGHAVRALYLACAVTDVYLETGDESLLQAAVRQWEDMVAGKTYLTGGVGSRDGDEAFGEAYDLPPDHAYCETCAAVASIMWSWRLLLATGESRYADLIERTLYNGFLAGLSLDGQRFFYVNPLHVRGRHERAPWHEVACCPPNVMRLLSSLEHYVATATDAGLQLHQYVSGTVRSSGPAGAIALEVATEYPWAGRIELSVAESPDAPWTLSLRVPGWCSEAGLSVDGVEVPLELGASGYAEIARRWEPGDRVALELAMPPHLVAPHPWIDAVRGCLALERGPLVYCLEQADLPSGADLAAVTISEDTELEAVGRPDLLGGVVTIEATGALGEGGGWAGWPYRAAEALRRESAASNLRLVAIPYFAWGNRGAGPMRVWIRSSGGPAKEEAGM